MRQGASRQQDPGPAGAPGNTPQAMRHLPAGSQGPPPDGPEAQTPQHLQCRSKMSPNFSSIILKHHFKALSETNCCFKLERAMLASCSDNVGGRDLLQWVCSIVRENRHDSNMLGIFGDLPDSQAASEAP